MIGDNATKWLPATRTDVPLEPVTGETLFAVATVTSNVPADAVFVPSVALTASPVPGCDASANVAKNPPVALVPLVTVCDPSLIVIGVDGRKLMPSTVTEVPLEPVTGVTVAEAGVVTLNNPADTVLVPSVALTGKLVPDLDASVNVVLNPPVVFAVSDTV